jgi:hypothetical protein
VSALTPERAGREVSEARWYAQLIHGDHGGVDWTAVNRDLIDRYSVTALRRIKRLAWQLVQESRR